MTAVPVTSPAPAFVPASINGGGFVFERDSFAFANELVWEYRFDAQTGRATTIVREPRPDYTLRCFVLTAAARQFHFHAAFDATQPRLSESEYRRLLRQVLARSPRRMAAPGERILFPGFAGLRPFSVAFEQLLKAECGGAWRSYVLRSHWRMVFPISRRNQTLTAERLQKTLADCGTAVVHLVRFPKLTINHGVVLFGQREVDGGIEFETYDPNEPRRPTTLAYDAATRSFSLPPNAYWPGGELDVIQIYRNWFI